MKKITKVASIVLYVLLAVSVILSALMILGPTAMEGVFEVPVFTDTVLNYAIVLVFATLVITLLFEIVNMIVNPGAAKRSLISAGIIILILGISYVMADGTPMTIIGYEGKDNVPSMLNVTDTGLFTFYILFGVAVFSILVTEVSRLFK